MLYYCIITHSHTPSWKVSSVSPLNLFISVVTPAEWLVPCLSSAEWPHWDFYRFVSLPQECFFFSSFFSQVEWNYALVCLLNKKENDFYLCSVSYIHWNDLWMIKVYLSSSFKHRIHLKLKLLLAAVNNMKKQQRPMNTFYFLCFKLNSENHL